MPKLLATIQKAVTSTTVGVGSLAVASSGSARRIRFSEFICGSDAATLGTSNFRWELSRSTTIGTGTAFAAQPLDTGDTVYGTDVRTSLTANGTITSASSVLTIAISQQATFRWVAAPGGEILIPGTSSAGIHFMTPVCGNTPSAVGHLFFEEL